MAPGGPKTRGGYIQPSEFLLGRGGVVLGSIYASGPVGRMGAEEAVRLITNRENRRRGRGRKGPLIPAGVHLHIGCKG